MGLRTHSAVGFFNLCAHTRRRKPCKCIPYYMERSKIVISILFLQVKYHKIKNKNHHTHTHTFWMVRKHIFEQIFREPNAPACQWKMEFLCFTIVDHVDSPRNKPANIWMHNFRPSVCVCVYIFYTFQSCCRFTFFQVVQYGFVAKVIHISWCDAKLFRLRR